MEGGGSLFFLTPNTLFIVRISLYAFEVECEREERREQSNEGNEQRKQRDLEF